MEKICDNNKCTGCLACMNACPKDAISVIYDSNGLMLPHIDQNKCVNCGLCEKTCPVNHPVQLAKPIKAYAAWNLDDNKHALSSSGGLARAMYDFAIDNGGVCYGTRFDENLDLKIVRADKKEELDEFQGSKYVQAIVGDSPRLVKKDLEDGRLVVYVGTPCQIAGLRNYLKKDYDNLITADLICHGVPSIKLLHDHVDHIENRIGKKADKVSFRGLYNFKMALYKKGDLIYLKNRWQDPYFTGFLQSLFYRPNCYECRYACDERVSDITLGDFWGIGEEKPFTKPDINGVSVVLPITSKGLDFIEKMKTGLYLEERSVSEAVKGNTQLNRPSSKHSDHDMFFKLYTEKGFEKAANTVLKSEMREFQKKDDREHRLLIKAKIKWKIINTCRKLTGRGVGR